MWNWDSPFSTNTTGSLVVCLSLDLYAVWILQFNKATLWRAKMLFNAKLKNNTKLKKTILS